MQKYIYIQSVFLILNTFTWKGLIFLFSNWFLKWSRKKGVWRIKVQTR